MARRQLSQLLAYLSKFPTLLQYKMMGITPLVFYVSRNRLSLSQSRCKCTHYIWNTGKACAPKSPSAPAGRLQPLPRPPRPCPREPSEASPHLPVEFFCLRGEIFSFRAVPVPNLIHNFVHGQRKKGAIPTAVEDGRTGGRHPSTSSRAPAGKGLRNHRFGD